MNKNEEVKLCPVCEYPWADHLLGGNCGITPWWTRGESILNGKSQKYQQKQTQIRGARNNNFEEQATKAPKTRATRTFDDREN